jgi:hypothetical protein
MFSYFQFLYSALSQPVSKRFTLLPPADLKHIPISFSVQAAVKVLEH